MPEPTDDSTEIPDEERPETDVLESDANGNGPEGLTGEMGLSSERVGDLRGNAEPGTHGAERTDWSKPPEIEDPPPEQSPDAEVGGPETPTPEDPADWRRHPLNTDRARPHSHG